MSTAPNDDYYQGSLLRRCVDDPRPLAWAGLGVLAISGWLFLFVMSAAQTGSDSYVLQLIASLCAVSDSGWTASDLMVSMIMWTAMAFAMMLPAGAPLLSTYLDISGAARTKDMEVVSPVVLIAGYISVWIGFAVAAAFAQWALVETGALNGDMKLINPMVAGVVLVGAGAWQFTTVKHNCLTKCRRPFTWFMANWRDDEAGVFKLGVEQGIVCLGCCWALMAVMFVAGLMNLAWMAGLAMVMVLEKVIPNPRPLVYGTGVILILGGAAMLGGLVRF